MNKKTVIWLIAAASLILIGSITIGGVLTMLKFNFEELSTVKYVTNSHDIDDEFQNISISVDTSDIVLLPSDNGKTKVVCYEDENSIASVTVNGDTLTIASQNTKKWYEHIGINWGTPKITVYLPKSEYASLSVKESTGDVEIPKDFKFETADISTTTGDVDLYASVSGSAKTKASTGNVSVSDVTVGSLEVSVSTGRVSLTRVNCDGRLSVKVSTGRAQLSDVKCGSLNSSGNTGDITLKKVIAAENFSIERTTGDVKFEGCDARDISVKTSTGDVTGSLLTEKLFSASSNTGKVSVPSPSGSQKCTITTDTGRIIITVQK